MSTHLRFTIHNDVTVEVYRREDAALGLVATLIPGFSAPVRSLLTSRLGP